MPTYLDAPFRDKDRVKALGGRWDAVQKRWFVPDGTALEPFATWLPVVQEPLAQERLVQEPLALATQDQGYALSVYLSAIQAVVAETFAQPTWVRVEVFSANARNGHVYLDVGERTLDGQELAKVRMTLWRQRAEAILPAFQKATGMVLGDGMKLLVQVLPEVSPRYGLSLQALAIDSSYTLGELEARKREIRQRLKAEGVFDQNRALPAPFLCERVLVLAPPAAAGLGDFRAEADRLQAHGVCSFRYAHSAFQGETAPAQMVKALSDALAEAQAEGWQPDVVVIIRGGGAVSDLAWLNDYGLARLVCTLPVPVYCGIGHERDSTLIDEVAHTAFDTPSKVILGIEEEIERRCAEARRAWQLVQQAAQARVASARLAVETAERTIRTEAVQAITTARLQSGALREQIAERAMLSVQTAQQRSQALMREIAGQGPEKTLARGWAIVRSPEGRVITQARDAQASRSLEIQLGNDTFSATPEAP